MTQCNSVKTSLLNATLTPGAMLNLLIKKWSSKTAPYFTFINWFTQIKVRTCAELQKQKEYEPEKYNKNLI